ncbi:MAG: type I restriction enzyme HsdR N-terminal domain-containing protein [Bacteroidetes bacterium]|jgi:type I site-specific restriction endonuclease|nr:type I restriction enzyme HsdR N-terminal domain-containing protein [Bacteroidota bacterium]
MIELNLPACEFKFKSDGQSKQIFDHVRKKYVELTPEEWVRQHFIMFLVNVKKYPDSLFAVEKEHVFNDLSMRADLVVYSRDLKPWMICEFKAADVAIGQDAFYQIGRYNLTYDVPYLVVSNGMEHYCMKRVDDTFEFLDDLPEYEH